MPSNSLHARPRRPALAAQVFDDEAARLWSATYLRCAGEWAVVFSCISDARQPVRALALGEDERPAEPTEAILRDWLTRAPRLGPLT